MSLEMAKMTPNGGTLSKVRIAMEMPLMKDKKQPPCK
jgi:hypothetical protein